MHVSNDKKIVEIVRENGRQLGDQFEWGLTLSSVAPFKKMHLPHETNFDPNNNAVLATTTVLATIHIRSQQLQIYPPGFTHHFKMLTSSGHKAILIALHLAPSRRLQTTEKMNDFNNFSFITYLGVW